MKNLLLALLISFSIVVPFAPAAVYQGAEAVLRQIDEQNRQAGPPGTDDPAAQLKANVKGYAECAAGLPPETNAREWLALFDQAVKLHDAPFRTGYETSPAPARLALVFGVLPEPAAWDALAAQIAARPAAKEDSFAVATEVLRIVSGLLTGQPQEARQAIEAVAKRADRRPGEEGLSMMVQQLQDAFCELTHDKQGTLDNFERKLARLRPGGSNLLGSPRGQSLDVPDLVAIAGPVRAEALLRQTLVLPLGGMSVTGKKTEALARRLALETAGQLGFAPWSLVETLDSTALYEALDKRFPASAEARSDRQTAMAYYLLGLVVQGKDAAAVKVALGLGADVSETSSDEPPDVLPGNALDELAAKGYAKEVYRFFDRLLAEHPELPYWSGLTSSAVLAGENDALLARARAASERTDLKPSTLRALRRTYADALLAADHVEEALPLLRGLAASQAPPDPGLRRSQVDEASQHSRLALLGQALGDDSLVKEQLDAFVEASLRQARDTSERSNFSIDEETTELFLKLDRGPDLERLLATDLLGKERLVQQRREQWQLANQNPAVDPFEASVINAPLLALANFYARAERFDDAVALLDHYPHWSVDDLAGLVSQEMVAVNGRTASPLARALQRTGHPDAALRLVNASLERHGGSDPLYALLLELLPPDRAEARLNELFQNDQFEERPLIWRASLQLDQGRLDEAERSARQAIAIDPSDGEEGRGDRMRAYAVLGDILERKGDRDGAGLMRRAVGAIRLSEDADRCRAAGLLTRAVGMYEQALGSFADAYCIQSRLAIQLTALGKFDEASAHYERAYELMPDSFGRMESHCFGCERAFAGERAQQTAERVFSRLRERQPDNPRVHYLLGYLRAEQDRRGEAAQEFRHAVRLDPDYINAWKQLGQNSDEAGDYDRAQLNLLRLDPRQKHDQASLESVSDLRALWSVVAAAAEHAAPPTTDIYPLAASKAALAEAAARRSAASVSPVGERFEAMGQFRQRTAAATPQAAILGNRVVVQALGLLNYGEGSAATEFTEE